MHKQSHLQTWTAPPQMPSPFISSLPSYLSLQVTEGIPLYLDIKSEPAYDIKEIIDSRHRE